MSQPTHSKGPWWWKWDGNNRMLYTSEEPNLGGALMSDAEFYPWTPSSDADWNLIAAAPELLEALQEAHNLLRDASECKEDERILPQFLRLTSDRAQAAIAKATGTTVAS